MTWYQTGTVAVTNGGNTIAGTGTNWIDQGVGWWMWIDGETVPAEIAAVVSSTQITARNPIQRATASGLNYLIIPTQGLTLSLREQIAELILTVQNTKASWDAVVADFSATAYQLWLDEGNTGTAADFLDGLIGPPGPMPDSLISRFSRTPIKQQMIPLLDRGGDILAGIDIFSGLLKVAGVSQIGADVVPVGGKVPLRVDEDGNVIEWIDRRSGFARAAGDILDQSAGSNGAQFVARDERGQEVFRIDGEGVAQTPAVAPDAPIFYTRNIDDGGGAVSQVFMVDGAAEHRLTASQVDCFAPQIVAPGLVRYARADGEISYARAPRNAVDGGADISMVVVYGQSLAIGSNSYNGSFLPVEVPHPPSANVLMFNGGVRTAFSDTAYSTADFTSLVSAFEAGENVLGDTGATCLGFNLAKEIGRDVLVTSTGWGGQPYANLAQGTQPYANLMYGVTRGEALASGGFRVDAMDWRQGESNEGDTSAQYRAKLIELQGDFATDVAAITSQPDDPILVLQQIQRMQETTESLSGQAAWEIEGPAQAVADLLSTPAAGIHIAGPQYVCDFGDAFHMLPESYQFMASYKAKAIRRVVYQGIGFKPLYAVEARRNGNRIDVRFAGGWVDHGGAICLDTSWVTDPGNYGVVFADDTMTAVVTNVSVVARDVLRVYLDTAPTGTNPRLGFAWWAAAQNDDQGRDTGLRCCIRDNDPDACPVTGRPLHNYALSHTIAV